MEVLDYVEIGVFSCMIKEYNGEGNDEFVREDFDVLEEVKEVVVIILVINIMLWSIIMVEWDVGSGNLGSKNFVF